jgi:hypothetical protein
MSLLNTLETVETELGKIRRTAAKAEDTLILYLIDMTILAVKRKAISECKPLDKPTFLRSGAPEIHDAPKRDLARRRELA